MIVLSDVLSAVNSQFHNMARQIVNTVWTGDAESGKTSLLTSYTQDIFPQEYVPTVFENYTAKAPALDGTERMINLNMRATAGEDEFDPQTDVVVIVCSVASRESFSNAETKWIPKAKKQLPGKPVILVGTKTDLRNKKDATTITYKEGARLAKKSGVRKYVECSAKELNSVKAVFGEVMHEHFKNEKTRRKVAQRNTCASFGLPGLKEGDTNQSGDGLETHE